MTDSLKHLAQAELLQLGLVAMQRDEDARAVVFLKEAADRPDASAQALFLLGSLYAQIGLYEQGIESMTRAVAVDPSYAIARFQLGMLHLSSGQAESALSAWAPLDELDEENPLRVWRQGLEYLIQDDFENALAHLHRGLALNAENPALNTDIQRIIDRIEQLPTRPTAAPAEAAETEEPQMSHLFLSIYSKGKAH